MMDTIIEEANTNPVVPMQVYKKAEELIAEAIEDGLHTGDLEQTFETILELLQHCVFLGMGRVLLNDPERNVLSIRYGYDVPEYKLQVTYTSDEGLTGHVFRTGQAITTFNLTHIPEYKGKVAKVYELPYVNPAFTAVPIKNELDETLGVLCANHCQRGTVETKEVLKILSFTASKIATLLCRQVH
ncbi:MAG: GAF domain-containing protein [Gammaproteobacteria bacterium]|nr:GAF domain-containing protein [Gammaproteobacteria bacterium]